MLEPPRPGFTGTVWEAVPPEQLVREVTTGSGATPMTEAGLAYSGLAAGLTEAATEFRAVLSVLGDAWTSSSSADGLNQLAALAEWLDGIAAAAQSNAAIAGRQAAAYQLARNTVPQLAQVDQTIHAAQDLLHGLLPGALLAGLLDTAEHRLDDVQQQAARAMRSYETASEQLAHPWQHNRAPEVSAGANLLAEQSNSSAKSAQPAEQTAAAPPPLEHAMSDLVQPDLSALQSIPSTPMVPVGGEALAMTPALPMAGTAPAATATTPVQAVQSHPVTSTPLVSPPATPGAPATHTPTPRAGASDAEDPAEKITLSAGFATAPAVLGGSGSAATRGADPATTNPEG
ncbi:PPE domain-containing protein [Nocardia miyunensis]|uniref:PPE domain-containing protein n=1 Tax=Nocardia miyunensis TaxID=282684 RepID=UPI000A7D6FDB|nr:PPE domain-containing protein [Nocardia miyunensis]